MLELELALSNKQHVINSLMLTFILVEKGICTNDELEQARKRASTMVEREIITMQAEREAEEKGNIS
jgi:hypothetical protein